MLFTSYGFIAFVLVLLPVYYLVPRRWQKGVLLIANLLFYGLADWRYLLYIVGTALSIWFCGVKIGQMHSAAEARIRADVELSRERKKAIRAKAKACSRVYFLAALLLNLGVLAVTKYTDFAVRSVCAALHRPFGGLEILIPMGISFYTFQAVAYLIDVYRQKTQPQRCFGKFLLFVSFFPQLVQGPISRYDDMAPSLLSEHPFDGQAFSMGLFRVAWGYFKKVVLADRLLSGVQTLVAGSYEGAFVFAAMLFYAFELYCDFTGGIDITIGLAQMLGIRLKENFRLPYFSRSTKEYWNRWHISMGAWFTEYIFYPVSVSKPMLNLSKWSRKHLGQKVGKRVPVYLASLLVWSATGLWHGAAWNFLAWGIANFVVIMVSQELEPLYTRFHAKFPFKKRKGYAVFEVVRTILLMSCIRMFDCYRDVPLTLARIGSMCTRWNWSVLFSGSLLQIGLSAADYGVLVVGFALVLSVSLVKNKRGSVRELLWDKPALFTLCLVLLVAATIVFGAYGAGYNAGQFIYNQF